MTNKTPRSHETAQPTFQVNQITHTIDDKRYHQLTKLVGKKCTVHCRIDEIDVSALWDTGAQVSLISAKWWEQHFPNRSLRDINELLQEDLDLRTANGTTLPFHGWTDVQLTLSLDGKTTQCIGVPFLVTSIPLSEPIIGFNAIAELTANKQSIPVGTPIGKAFGKLTDSKVATLRTLLESTDDHLGQVRLGRSSVKFPKGEGMWINCRTRTRCKRKSVAIFEPEITSEWPEDLVLSETVVDVLPGSSSRIKLFVQNNSSKDIFLKARTRLGRLEMVRSVMNLPDNRSSPPDDPANHRDISSQVSGVQADESHSSGDRWLPPVDLSHLSSHEQEMARKMLEEENSAFAKNEHDTGNAPDLQLRINLKDHEPVRKT